MNQDFINVIFSIVCSAIGWFMATLYKSIKDTNDRISKVEIHAAEIKVKHEYLNNMATRFEQKIDTILDILSKKADK